MSTATLSKNSQKIDDTDAIIKAALDKKRKLIVQSKVIAYDEIAKLFDLEGQELIDTITAEHTLIGKLTASGMSYEQIGELVDSDTDNGVDVSETLGQTSFFEKKTNPYSD